MQVSGNPPRRTTLAYTASTAATGNPALILAGLVTSVIFGRQRAVAGGVLAPAVTHVTWSLLMLRYLPPLGQCAGKAAQVHTGTSEPADALT